MNIHVESGRYVVAVSGGVDSMALLHVIQALPGMQLTVAHFDHGIRRDSHKDRLLVQQLAKSYNLPFVYDEGRLSPESSENQARIARYSFLHKVRTATASDAIITAHHQDDVIETAILNIIRGTGRKGITSLENTFHIYRPFLDTTKSEIIEYARSNNLTWHEDTTNADTKYLRNYVRHKLLIKFSHGDKQHLLEHIINLRSLNATIDQEIDIYIGTAPTKRLSRLRFILLPHNVSLEVMARWLRINGVREFDTNTLQRLVVGAKTLAVGKKMNVAQNVSIDVHKEHLALIRAER